MTRTHCSQSTPPESRWLSSSERPPSLVAVLSGKGGVGKTNIAVNLAVAAAHLKSRVLLVDGDLSLANVDALLGLTPRSTVADVLAGHASFEDTIIDGPGGVHIVPAASARMDLAAARPGQLTELLAPILRATHSYDLVLIDIGAGIGPAVMSLAAICTRALLVTTPEPTSVADAYATFKVLKRVAPRVSVELLVNMARDYAEAEQVHEQLDRVARHFLGESLSLRAHVPRDPKLLDAVASQKPVVEAFPTCPSARKLIELARALLSDAAAQPAPASNPDPRDLWRRLGS